jgi:hypothetical protein
LLLIPVFEAAFCRLFGLVFLPRFPQSVSELRRRLNNVRLLVRRIPHSKEQERAAAVLICRALDHSRGPPPLNLFFGPNRLVSQSLPR